MARYSQEIQKLHPISRTILLFTAILLTPAQLLHHLIWRSENSILRLLYPLFVPLIVLLSLPVWLISAIVLLIEHQRPIGRNSSNSDDW